MESRAQEKAQRRRKGGAKKWRIRVDQGPGRVGVERVAGTERAEVLWRYITADVFAGTVIAEFTTDLAVDCA